MQRCASCIVLLVLLSAHARVVVDMSAATVPAVVYVSTAEVTAGTGLEVAYGPGQIVSQTDAVGSCVAQASPPPVVQGGPSPTGGLAPLALPALGGQQYLLIATRSGVAGCVRTVLVTYDVLVDVTPTLPYPVSAVAQPGQAVVFFSTAPSPERLVANDTGPAAPAPVQWAPPTQWAALLVSEAQRGRAFVLQSLVHAPVRVYLWVEDSARDVRVSVAPTGYAPAAFQVPLGGRVLWQLAPDAVAADARAYLRLSDETGSVPPLSSFAYAVAYVNTRDLLPDAQTPLQQRMTTWATPPHHSGTWFYRDLFQSTVRVAYRVVVLGSSGQAPTDPPRGPAPSWQDYFQATALGIKCSCDFGAAASNNASCAPPQL